MWRFGASGVAESTPNITKTFDINQNQYQHEIKHNQISTKITMISAKNCFGGWFHTEKQCRSETANQKKTNLFADITKYLLDNIDHLDFFLQPHRCLPFLL
jgi:hypothetical protein